MQTFDNSPEIKNGYQSIHPHIVQELHYGRVKQNGLTKREYFAVLAMQGFCSNDNFQFTDNKLTAEMAVKKADALLKALESKPTLEAE